MGSRLIDLTGQRFGRLLVVSQAESVHTNSGTYAMWNCVCDCGKEVCVRSKALRRGNTMSCGCYNKYRVSELCLDDLTGQNIGSLNILNRAEDHVCAGGKHRVMWNCKCKCGKNALKAHHILDQAKIHHVVVKLLC